MRRLSARLVGREGATPAGWDQVFTPLMDRYVEMDWPVHRPGNVAWTEGVAGGLKKLLPEVIARLEDVFVRNCRIGRSWVSDRRRLGRLCAPESGRELLRFRLSAAAGRPRPSADVYGARLLSPDG